MKELFDNLISYPANQDLIIPIISMVSSFTLIIPAYPNLVSVLLEKLITLTGYSDPALPSETILSIRRKAISSLLKHAKEVPDFILPFIPQIKDLLLQQKQLVTPGEFSLMVEFICAVM
jgi:hypothetical protein